MAASNARSRIGAGFGSVCRSVAVGRLRPSANRARNMSYDPRSIIGTSASACQVVVKQGFGESYDSEIHKIIILSPKEHGAGNPLICDNCGSRGMEDCGMGGAKCGSPWEWRLGWCGRLWEVVPREQRPNMEDRVTPRWKPMGMAAKHGSPWERATGEATPAKGGSVWEGRVVRRRILEDRGKPSARDRDVAGIGTVCLAGRNLLTKRYIFRVNRSPSGSASLLPFPRDSIFQRRVPSPPRPTAFHL